MVEALKGGGNGRDSRFAKKELPVQNSYCRPTGRVEGCVLGADTGSMTEDGEA